MISFKSKDTRQRSAICTRNANNRLDPHLHPLPSQGEEAAKRQVRLVTKKPQIQKESAAFEFCRRGCLSRKCASGHAPLHLFSLLLRRVPPRGCPPCRCRKHAPCLSELMPVS